MPHIPSFTLLCVRCILLFFDMILVFLPRVVSKQLDLLFFLIGLHNTLAYCVFNIFTYGCTCVCKLLYFENGCFVLKLHVLMCMK